jgi:DNA-binding transcriptional MocR family regulator
VSQTIWQPSKVSPRGPVYLAIADALAADLEAGRVRPGERLPTHRELARTLGVNVVTITRAYAEAARRGLVEGHVGRGTFVRSIEERPRARPERGAIAGAIDLSQNQIALAPESLDVSALVSSMVPELAAALDAGYQPAGQREHRAAGARWLAGAGLSVDPERVLVTTGGQQALATVFATYAKAGDTVLVEELTYAGVKSLAALFRLRLVPVAIDEQGLVPEALEEACRRGNPKLLYCMPNLQNPTGVVLAPERRKRIAELAERYDLLVLEDDASGFLLESPPPPIAALVPERGLFVTSLSKSLAPGLRVGYLAAPERELEALHRTQAALTWMTPVLTAAIASQLIQSGALARVVEKKRAEVRRRRALFARALPQLSTASHPDSPCAWVGLPEPWRSEEFVAAAERAGVLVSGAETFVVSRTHTPHAARLCLGAPAARAEVETALARLAGLLEGVPSPCRALV